MGSEKTEGILEELKGIVKKTLGVITRDENRQLEGEAQIVEGDNRKDFADQRENQEKRKTRSGDPTNL